MIPNDEFMYRYAQERINEIRRQVEAERGLYEQAGVMRRRLTVIAGMALVGLTLFAMLLVLGWWFL